ncbi:MAG: DUF6516 family protein [Thiotrichaceae bacterium]
MFDAANDYLQSIQARLSISTIVISITNLRLQAQGDMGLYRLRLKLIDNSLLECFELFEFQGETKDTLKYSFHWQTNTGQLISRWDNAPHHGEIDTFPNHVHEEQEDNVKSHHTVDMFWILQELETKLAR